MSNMSFEEFKSEVVEKIREFLPESFAGASVELQVVSKNNGLELTGLTIKTQESNMVPVIYLESFYEQYEAGTELEMVLRRIAEIRVENDKAGVDTSDLLSFDKCKNKIVPRLYNFEANSGLLKNRVHRKIEDLAITYHIVFDECVDGEASAAVTKDILKMWGVSEEELHTIALENLKKVTAFSSMMDVLRGMLQDDEAEAVLDVMDDDEKMFVLSNKSKSFGAAALLDKELMSKIIAKFGKFYILPSSVHEVLIVPAHAGMEPGDLAVMVRDVNSSCVKTEDKLSDHVYAYTDEKGLVIVE